MNLKSCEKCGVVVDLDVFNKSKDENPAAKLLVSYSWDYQRGFFCPVCNEMIVEYD